jgi:hypothetical protein
VIPGPHRHAFRSGYRGRVAEEMKSSVSASNSLIPPHISRSAVPVQPNIPWCRPVSICGRSTGIDSKGDRRPVALRTSRPRLFRRACRISEREEVRIPAEPDDATAAGVEQAHTFGKQQDLRWGGFVGARHAECVQGGTVWRSSLRGRCRDGVCVHGVRQAGENSCRRGHPGRASNADRAGQASIVSSLPKYVRMERISVVFGGLAPAATMRPRRIAGAESRWGAGVLFSPAPVR